MLICSPIGITKSASVQAHQLGNVTGLLVYLIELAHKQSGNTSGVSLWDLDDFIIIGTLHSPQCATVHIPMAALKHKGHATRLIILCIV